MLAAHPDWRLRALLFQGFETDAKNGMLATTFRRALDRFVKAIRADLGAPDLPIVFGELPPAFVDADPSHAAIRDELALATRRLPYTAVASSRSPSVAEDDGLHYSAAGLLAIGEPLCGRARRGRGERARRAGPGPVSAPPRRRAREVSEPRLPADSFGRARPP